MAARGHSSVKPRKISHGFVRALESAVLEWFLICLLFIDAIFSYLITRFARYCELQTPCLICSRLDHVLGNEKLKYYRDLFCSNHKLEISSLVFCHAHNKLVDVRGMCENCLFSFAKVNKSNAETYRLLVGKVGENSGFGSDEDLLLEGHKTNQSIISHCSCCNEPWIARGNAQKLMPSKSSGSEPAKVDVPSSGADEHNQHCEKRSEKPSVVFRATHPESNGQDSLSHVGYTELKVDSDTESEVLLSDDDASAQICEIDGPKQDLAAQYVQLDPSIIILSNDSAQEKLLDPVSRSEPSLPVSQVNSDVIEPTTTVGHGLKELNWEQVDIQADPSALANLVSLDDVPSLPKAEKTSVDVSNERNLISVDDVPPSSNAGKISTDVLEENAFIHLDIHPSSKSEESPTDVSKESNLTSLDEVSLPSNAVESSVDVSEECQLISLNNVPPSAKEEKASIDVLEESWLVVDDTLSSSFAGKTSLDVSKENKLKYPDAPTSLKSKESPTGVSKESKFISLDEISLQSNAVESSLDVSKQCKLISLNDAPPSPVTEKASTDMSNESKLLSVNYILPLSNSGNTSLDVSKENELISHGLSRSSKPKKSSIDISQESKFISIDEVSLPSDAVESVDVSEKCKLTSLNDAPPSYGGDGPYEVSKDSKVIFLDDGLQPSDAMESHSEAWKESCVARSVELGETECEEICEAISVPNTLNETAAERNPVSSDTASQTSNLLDLSDAYKVAVGNRGRQLSGVLAEQWFGKDSSRVSEDLKFLLSQLSAARGFEQLVSDMSPKLRANSEELKTSDTASSNGMQILHKRISLERNGSGFESLDGSIVSEIEGESVVDRLKRQIEHDRKLLSAVYKELEEERNASADAVNQAMAMITRLQEEKASLHMEALQSLRMMEEQAEYDMEALQKTNDLLAEKEKEIQDLEEELEYYRMKYPNDSMLKSVLELNSNSKEKETRMDHSVVTCVEESSTAQNNSVIKSPKTDMSEDMKTGAVKNSVLAFEDEKWYILQSLKKLEKKLYMFSYNGLYSDLGNGEYSGEVDEANDLKELNCKGDSHVKSRTEGNDSLTLNDAYESKGSPRARGCISSLEKTQFSEQTSPELCKGTDLVSLEKEISDLSERLEALELDQNFLELTINSLKKGEEGVRFIQEIAYHLRELRSIGIRRREENVA